MIAAVLLLELKKNLLFLAPTDGVVQPLHPLPLALAVEATAATVGVKEIVANVIGGKRNPIRLGVCLADLGEDAGARCSSAATGMTAEELLEGVLGFVGVIFRSCVCVCVCVLVPQTDASVL